MSGPFELLFGLPQSGNGSTAVVPDIADRNALIGITVGFRVTVVDATDDPTVATGSATYVWTGIAWLKTSESESLDFIGSPYLASQTVETDGSSKLITAAKGTAYNKNFGTAAGDVCEGSDIRLSDDRVPLLHTLNDPSVHYGLLTAGTGTYSASTTNKFKQFLTPLVAVNTNYLLTPLKNVTKIGIFTAVEQAGQTVRLGIVKKITSSSFYVLHEEDFVMVGADAYEQFTLSSTQIIPSDGSEYYLFAGFADSGQKYNNTDALATSYKSPYTAAEWDIGDTVTGSGGILAENFMFNLEWSGVAPDMTKFLICDANGLPALSAYGATSFDATGAAATGDSNHLLAFDHTTLHTHSNKTTLDAIPNHSTATTGHVIKKQSGGGLAFEQVIGSPEEVQIYLRALLAQNTEEDIEISDVGGLAAELATLVKTDGTRPFTAVQQGITPVNGTDLVTKAYVDSQSGGGGGGSELALAEYYAMAGRAFGWKDLKGESIIRTGGGAAPALATFAGNIAQYQMDATDEFSVNFHMPHDWAIGTDVFIHVHWAITTASGPGTYQYNFEHTYGKREGIISNTTKTVSTSAVAPNASARFHHVTEIQISRMGGSATEIDTNELDTDGVIMTRMTRTLAGGAVAAPFIFYVDLHYQTNNRATPNKAAPFWG